MGHENNPQLVLAVNNDAASDYRRKAPPTGKSGTTAYIGAARAADDVGGGLSSTPAALVSIAAFDNDHTFTRFLFLLGKRRLT